MSDVCCPTKAFFSQIEPFCPGLKGRDFEGIALAAMGLRSTAEGKPPSRQPRIVSGNGFRN
jgi:hypothetical protein